MDNNIAWLSFIYPVKRLIGILGVLTLLYAPATLATSQRSHLSSDPDVRQARALVENKHFSEALNVLRSLPADHPDSIDILFLTGLAAMRLSAQMETEAERTALLDEAIIALRDILVIRPGLTRVRLELAQAFFLKGDNDLSQRHFNLVLAGKPPPAMEYNVRRFLYSIRARRKWSGYLSVSVVQNDNINSGTDTETIYLFGLPFDVNEESRPRSGAGLLVSTGGEYQYPLGQHWRWRIGTDAAHIEYAGHEFDENWLQFRTGPRWLASSRSEASLQATVAQRWVARSPHSREQGLRFDARHQFSRRLSTHGRVSWTDTRHRRISSADHTEIDYVLNGVWLFSPLLQGNLGVGLSEERPEIGGQNRERRINGGLGMVLPKGWTISGNLEWLRRQHGFNVPFSNQRRVDHRRTVRLLALNRGFTLFGFSPQLVVAREWQRSNSTLSEYQRTRVDLRFVRQF